MKKLFQSPKKGQKQKLSVSASTGTNAESSALPAPGSPLSSAILLHLSCKTISIALFKDAYCNNNIKALIIEGTPDEIQLQNAWDEIMFEYGSLFKSEDSQYLFELGQRITSLQADIAQTDYSIYYLKELFKQGKTDQQVVDQLSFLGYPGEFDIEKPEKYMQDLDRCISLCKTHLFDLQELVAEYDRLNKTKTGKKQTEEEFDQNITMLNKYQHYQIDEEKVTIYKFAIIFNNYLAEMTMRNKAAQNAE